MDRSLVVVDEAATLVNNSPEARALVNELLAVGRKNDLPEPDEFRFPRRQYPTLVDLEEAAPCRP